ncbi:MAG: hypothetical protein AAB532_03375 [Patescibacteria group bacterium]
MDSRKQIIKTLSYFNFFDYPLTLAELLQFTKTDIKSKEDFYSLVKQKDIESFKSFYFLSNRKNIVGKRLEREKESNKKLLKAKKVIKKISNIPTVNFIGISGSLAMKNSGINDDIDIFVISKDNLVWLTRLLLVFYLKTLGVYRKKHEKSPKDKICLNLIIGDGSTSFTKKRQNLYIAHEIVQLMPLFQRENTYLNFIDKNKWIFKFLPNANKRIKEYKIPFNKNKSVINDLLVIVLQFLRIEKIAKFLQWNYMKKDVTLETIEDNFLAFHPIDFKKKVNKFFD